MCPTLLSVLSFDIYKVKFNSTDFFQFVSYTV